MKNRFTSIIALVASSTILLAGCSEDNSSFETPNASGTTTNDGLISQNNFLLSATPENPQYIDLSTNEFTAVTSEIAVKIGDNNNQLITGSHTIQFRTEWGLIDPSCTTEDGTCSVTWRSGSPGDMPSNLQNTIIAYSANGQESYKDFDDNGLFNDGDSFVDIDEPFINLNENLSVDGKPIFDTGELIIDTINGVDITGANLEHDYPDGFYNGPNCAHSTLCSTTRVTSTVWADVALSLTGGDTFTIGGTVTGLTGPLVLQNNLSDDLSLSADGNFTFSTSVADGLDYEVTVKTAPAGQTCAVANATGTVAANVTSVNITCATTTYTIGGTVITNLLGTGLVLRNNDVDDLTIANTDTSYTFATALVDGATYAVTPFAQPTGPNQTCIILNDTGTVPAADVTDADIECTTTQYTIGGTVSIPVGQTLTIQNNLDVNGDNIVLTDADTNFEFATALDDESNYDVTQVSYSNGTCVFTNNMGTLAGDNVINIDIVCP